MTIVPKKAKHAKLTFRWSPDLVAEIDRIAEHTGRSQNECGEYLMRWAVQQALREIDQEQADATARNRKK